MGHKGALLIIQDHPPRKRGYDPVKWVEGYYRVAQPTVSANQQGLIGHRRTAKFPALKHFERARPFITACDQDSAQQFTALPGRRPPAELRR
jgi:hypothetical protein